MKETLLNLLTALLALAQTPKANEDEAAKIQGIITDHLNFAKTAHGDSEIADPEIQDKLNDLSTVLGSSEPDPEHAEVPEFDDETETAEETTTEEPTEEELAAQQQAEEEAAAAAAAEEAKKKAPAKKILTIKEKREAQERAAAAAAPAKPKPLGLKKK